MTLAHSTKSAAGRWAGRLKDIVTRESEDDHILTPAEAWALYDAEARKHLGISADEFEREWKKGTYRSRQEDFAVRSVVMVRTGKPRA